MQLVYEKWGGGGGGGGGRGCAPLPPLSTEILDKPPYPPFLIGNSILPV